MPARRRRGKNDDDDFEIGEDEIREMEKEQEAAQEENDEELEDIQEAADEDGENKTLRNLLHPFDEKFRKNGEERDKELHAISVEFSKRFGDKFYQQRGEILKQLPEIDSAAAAEDAPKGFWTTIFQNDVVLSEFVAEDDVEILDALINISVTAMEDKLGFVTKFHFRANKAFTNTVLERKDWMQSQVYHSTGTEIKWAAARKKKGIPRYDQSFLAVFYPPKMPKNVNELTGRLKESLERDWMVGERLRVHIAPVAYSVYAKDASKDGLKGEVFDELKKQQEDFHRQQIAHVDALTQCRAKYQAKADAITQQRRVAITAPTAPAPLKLVWVSAILNHPTASLTPSPKDFMALEFLVDVRVEMKGRSTLFDTSDLNSFDATSRTQNWALIFEFAPNDFFSDQQLWAEFGMKDGEVVEVRTSGIKWKEGHRLTVHGGHLQLPAGKKRYRYSFFLMFEETEKRRKSPTGLMTVIEKEGIARTYRYDLIPNVTAYFSINTHAIDEVNVPVDDSSDEEDLGDVSEDESDEDAAGGSGAKGKRKITKVRSRKPNHPTGFSHKFCVYLISFLLVGGNILGLLSFFGLI